MQNKTPFIQPTNVVRCQRLFDKEDETKYQMLRNRPDRKLIETDVQIRKPCLTVFTQSKSMDSIDFSKRIRNEPSPFSINTNPNTINNSIRNNQSNGKVVRVQSTSSITSVGSLSDLLIENELNALENRKEREMKKEGIHIQKTSQSKVSVSTLSSLSFEDKTENECDESEKEIVEDSESNESE